MRRALAALVIAAACARKPAPPPQPDVVLTTSDASSIAVHLAAAFERQTSRKLSVRIETPQQIQSATGAAAIVRERDVPLNNAPLRSVFAYSDFEMLGPAHDPAHVRTAPDAETAFRRIAARHRKFCVPADLPSSRELAPHGIECHGSASDVLATASRLGAYTILDRASASTRMPRGYKVLLHDVPPLHTAYVVALLPSAAPHKDAEWFVEWVMSFRGRDAIESIPGPKLVLPEQH